MKLRIASISPGLITFIMAVEPVSQADLVRLLVAYVNKTIVEVTLK